MPTEGGAALLWSDRSGAYLRRLGADGAPAGDTTRLGAACPGGLAAAVEGGALVVACLVPADRDRDREGEVLVMRVRGESVQRLAATGPVGTESDGVDVVAGGDRVVVGWRDADPFTARTRLAELRGGELEGEPRALSTQGMLGGAPSLSLDEGALWAAWTVSWLDAGGDPVGHLVVQREGREPVSSLDVGDLDVRVHLTRDARGPMVSVRDRRPRDRPLRAFVGRLRDDLTLTERDLRLPGRADSHRGRSMLVPCGEHVFSVATRRSSRGVTMVSLRRLDAELRPAEDEQQIYEYHARFPHAVGACVDGRLLVAIGERQTEQHPTPRLQTYTLACAPGVEHERTPATDRAGRR